MVPSLKVAGTTTWLVVKAALYSQTVISMRASGPLTRQMDLENTFMPMELATKGSGVTIAFTDRAKSDGLIRVCIGEIMKMDSKMEQDSSAGKMEQLTTAAGEIIKCTDKGFSNGKMVDNTKENIIMILNMELELLSGLMVGFMREAGKEVKCMVQANLLAPTKKIQFL